MNILKRSMVEAELNSLVQMSGEFRLVVRRQDGSISRDTGWFKNLILDSGLNRMGTGTAISGCAISTGTATPAASQTSLQGTPVFTSTLFAQTASAAATYFSCDRTYRFAIGALNGSYNEIGVGWASGTMFSRALIVDGGGNPTPLPVSSAEQLDVLYRLRWYPPTVDTSNSVTIAGVATTVTGRSAWMNYATNFSDRPLGLGYPGSGGVNGDYGYVFNGAIGATTAGPAGTQLAASARSNDVYVNNSNSMACTFTWGTANGNHAGGVTAMSNCWVLLGLVFQYGFSTPIAKDANKTMTLKTSVTWSRKV